MIYVRAWLLWCFPYQWTSPTKYLRTRSPPNLFRAHPVSMYVCTCTQSVGAELTQRLSMYVFTSTYKGTSCYIIQPGYPSDDDVHALHVSPYVLVHMYLLIVLYCKVIHMILRIIWYVLYVGPFWNASYQRHIAHRHRNSLSTSCCVN